MAITVEVTISGKEIKRLEDIQFKHAMNEGLDRTIEYGQKVMKVYPFKRPGQRYVRTFAHREGITTEKTSYRRAVLTWTDRRSRTGRRYAHWVRDSRRQAEVHKGRWSTDRKVARQIGNKATGFYNEEFAKLK